MCAKRQVVNLMGCCRMDEKDGGRHVALRFVKVEIIGGLSKQKQFYWNWVVEALFKGIGKRVSISVV